MLHDAANQVFCSREFMGLKKLFQKLQEGYLVHDQLWYLSGIKEAFLCLFWPNPINQASAHEDIWFRGGCCLKNF